MLIQCLDAAQQRVAYSLFSVLLLACGYFAIHFAAQVRMMFSFL